jgi:hypothetical protein
MANYIRSVKSISYGTPTGTNTMPGSLTVLPNTVKGSITFEEAEGTYAEFFADQAIAPVARVKTDEGLVTFTCQFYDMDYASLTQFKGGATAGGAGSTKFVPSVGYTDVNKALEILFDTGHKWRLFNASCFARVVGGGGRDKMLAWELKATAQLTTDGAGIMEYGNLT